MKRRGSVQGQLLLAFCVLAVMIALAAGLGYARVSQQNAAARQLIRRDYAVQETAGHVQENFDRCHHALDSYALSGKTAYLKALPQCRKGFWRYTAELKAQAPAGLARLVKTQTGAGSQFFALSRKIVRLTPRSRALPRLGAHLEADATTFSSASKRLQDTVAGQARQQTAESRHSLWQGLAWGAVALGAALLLVLAGSLITLRTITRPLRQLTATVRMLTAGDHAARAPVAGAAEVREVASAVNAQADESDRLRAAEAESNRLRAQAREAGLRIRDHLVTSEVIDEARKALERCLDADVVHLRLLEDGELTAPVGHGPGRRHPAAGASGSRLTPGFLAGLRETFLAQGSMAVQDVQGEEGEQVPAELREPARRAGVAAQLLVPFGVGTTLLGVIVAQRLRPGRPWSPAEIDMMESIAADLGCGLHHARLYEAENRLVRELKALGQARTDFFATVSHELRAPLTTIEGYVEMLCDEEAGQITPQQRQMLATVERGAQRLRHLIEDLLTLSKLESGALTTVMQPVGLGEVIGHSVAAVEPAVASGGLTLSVRGGETGLMVAGDAGQLERALINLLSNAVKFTPHGGHIEVTAGAEDGSAVVTVRDTGIGVPVRDQQEMFNRFSRASNATARAIPGTGLGLAIVRMIVANHGGAVTLESQEGAGTTVTVRIPLAVPSQARAVS